MWKLKLSTASMSIALALALAAWEVYFFWFAGTGRLGSLEGTIGLFTPDRLGFNLAWLSSGYLTFQLLSIPFTMQGGRGRFLGVVDGMASLMPLAIVLIVLFGKQELLRTPDRWEAALLLMFVTIVDLFGGYAFTIALSRRTFDMAPSSP